MNNSSYSSWNLNSEDFQNSQDNSKLDTDTKYNGRIFFEENEFTPGYELFEGSKKKQTCYQDSVSTIQELTPLSKQYFDIANAEKIQQNIINEIRIRSNNEFNIGRQSDLQLQIIMRSIFLSYGKNLNSNINQQIEELNKMVIEECIKTILPNIKQYLHYREEISKPRTIMALSTNPSIKGNNQLGNSLFPPN
jgi:hypothetical protein